MKDFEKQLLAENSTAFYTFDISVLKNRVDYLKSRLPNEVSLCYAVKANTFIIKEIEGCVERKRYAKSLVFPLKKQLSRGFIKRRNLLRSLLRIKALTVYLQLNP